MSATQPGYLYNEVERKIIAVFVCLSLNDLLPSSMPRFQPDP